MWDGQIERELADGEPWSLWQQTRLASHFQQDVEPEQEAVDIYEEALQYHLEQSRKSLSSCLDISRNKGGLYQVISHFLGY